MSNKIREEQNILLQEIKSIIKSDSIEKYSIIGRSDKPLYVEVEDLVRRLENIEKQLENQPKETIREGRVKEQIITILQENKKLNSSELSKLIGLSRTRCNEYLRLLTKEGVTEGIIIGRQKYYKLVVR